MEPCRIELPTAIDDRGDLTFANYGDHGPFPFEVKRAYWITNIPETAERGGHAHIHNHEAIVAVHGAFTVTLESPDGLAREYRLSRPDEALYVPPMNWRVIDRYAPDTICLVLASDPYDPEDYIRNMDAFRAYA